MCGICGVVDFDQPDAISTELLQRMNNTLKHRGPDDAGVHLAPYVGLGHRRLSIIDVAGGHQPISNEDGTVWVLLNGEIYNYSELRQRLLQRGHRFSTKSDTEAIVHLFEDKGEECFPELRGMFSIALWDARQRKLVLARDRVGKKPLFYFSNGKQILFGSELKALLAAGTVPRTTDDRAVSDYFSLGYIPAPKTIYQGVSKVLPGHYLVASSSNVHSVRYWDVSFSGLEDKTEEQWCELLRQELCEATRVRLMSEVPLGAFLSGGVDSSAVVAVMSRIMNRPVTTCSIAFDQEEYNESEFARQVAEQFHTEHHEHKVQPSAVEILDKLAWHFDEPFADSSAIPTYYVSAVARQHVTVALGGDGGDENFAGYRRYYFDRSEITSQVEYGTSTSLGTTTSLNSQLVTNHLVQPSGLTANTTYYFVVKSQDAFGNQAVSSLLTFTTYGAPKTGATFPQGWTNLSTFTGKQVQLAQTPSICSNDSSIRLNDGCSGTIDAQSGGTLRTSTNQLIITGGGHQDFGGNSIYAVNLNANPISFTKIHNDYIPGVGSCANYYGTCAGSPSACFPASGVALPLQRDQWNNCLDPKGTKYGAGCVVDAQGHGCEPNARHTYGTLVYLPKTDQMLIYNGSTAAINAPNYFDAWIYDFASGTYTRKDPFNGNNPPSNANVSIPEAMFADWDSVNQKVYIWTQGLVGSWDPSTNTWQTLFTQNNSCVTFYGAIDPVARTMVVMGPCNGGKVYHINIDTGAGKALDVSATANANGCSAVSSATSPGMTYDTDRGHLVIWPNFGNTVYDYDVATMTCTPSTYQNGPADSHTSGTPHTTTGTFGRFRYVPSKHIYILVNDWNLPAMVLCRESGGC